MSKWEKKEMWHDCFPSCTYGAETGGFEEPGGPRGAVSGREEGWDGFQRLVRNWREALLNKGVLSKMIKNVGLEVRQPATSKIELPFV